MTISIIAQPHMMELQTFGVELLQQTLGNQTK
jgi:hypothetical protein